MGNYLLRRWGLVLLLGLSGCADVANMAATLNERQVQSCLYVNGAYGVFVGFHSITATGGASLDACLRSY